MKTRMRIALRTCICSGSWKCATTRRASTFAPICLHLRARLFQTIACPCRRFERPSCCPRKCVHKMFCATIRLAAAHLLIVEAPKHDNRSKHNRQSAKLLYIGYEAALNANRFVNPNFRFQLAQTFAQMFALPCVRCSAWHFASAAQS